MTISSKTAPVSQAQDGEALPSLHVRAAGARWERLTDSLRLLLLTLDWLRQGA